MFEGLAGVEAKAEVERVVMRAWKGAGVT